MAGPESISLEETNKIRISLGLAPLKPHPTNSTNANDAAPVSMSVDDEERPAVENLNSLRAQQAEIAQKDALRQRLQKYLVVIDGLMIL